MNIKSLRLEAYIAGFALVIAFLAVSWGVVARYIAPQPAAWSNELATISFAWIVFLGAAEGLRTGQHIGVDLLTSRLSERPKRILAILMTFLVAAGLSYFAYLSARIGIDSFDRPTPVLRLPFTVVHAAAFLGLTSMSVRSFIDGYRILRGDMS